MGVIGAITNGKGNPLKMEQTIHEYFDFCTSGEDDNVFPYRKPHEQIYLKSLDCFQNMIGSELSDDGVDDFFWVHVGDDLANDVAASSKCGAFAVWADLGDEYSQSASKAVKEEGNVENQDDGKTEQQSQPFWSTA